MPRRQVAIVGGVTGFAHTPGAYFLQDGRSLHPLQRLGVVSHSGYDPGGAAHHPGAGSGPRVPESHGLLIWPARLTPGLTLHPAVRV